MFFTLSSPLGAARIPTGRAPQRPARSTVRAVDARSASVLRARTRAPARTGCHVTTSRAGTAHRCRPPAFIGYIPWCALRSVYVAVSDTPAWVVAHLQTLATSRGWSPFIGLQVEYSLVQREVERELVPMAHGLGLSILAWGPLGAGVLSGKYASHTTASGDRRLSDVDPGRLAIADAVATVAANLDLSSAQVALGWLRAQAGVIPILGARTSEQLAHNLSCVDITLPGDALARLDEASRTARGFPHDFLAATDYIHGGLSTQLDLPPGRNRFG
jgi:Aldo/keto reductase family